MFYSHNSVHLLARKFDINLNLKKEYFLELYIILIIDQMRNAFTPVGQHYVILKQLVFFLLSYNNSLCSFKEMYILFQLPDLSLFPFYTCTVHFKVPVRYLSFIVAEFEYMYIIKTQIIFKTQII